MFRRTKGINHLTFFCVALFLIHSIWEQVPNTRVHLELEDAHTRIVALEAQLDGRNPPEVQVPAMALSPPRKRIRYGEPGSITRLL